MSQFITVAGSSYRCGSTLIQRLLNASGECIIHGEDNSILYSVGRTLYERKGNYRAEEQYQDLFDNPNSWTANALPSLRKYQLTYFNMFVNMFNCGNNFEELNKKFFGFKFLFPDPVSAYGFFYSYGSKMIYVSRNIDDAYESYANIYNWLSKEKFYALYERVKSFEEWLEQETAINNYVYRIQYEDINYDTVSQMFDWIGIENKSNIQTVLDTKITEHETFSRERAERKHAEIHGAKNNLI